MRNIDSAIYQMRAEEEGVIVCLTYHQASFLISYFEDSADILQSVLGADGDDWQSMKNLSGALIKLKRGLVDAKTVAIKKVQQEYDLRNAKEVERNG